MNVRLNLSVLHLGVINNFSSLNSPIYWIQYLMSEMYSSYESDGYIQNVVMATEQQILTGSVSPLFT